MKILTYVLLASLYACTKDPQAGDTSKVVVEKPAEQHHESHQGHDDGEEVHDDHEDHVKVEPSVLSHMDIKSTPLAGSSPWKVPVEACVTSGKKTLIYHEETPGSFSPIEVEVVRQDRTHAWITSKKLKVKDAVVTQGAKFLRLIELDAMAGAEGGHAH